MKSLVATLLLFLILIAVITVNLFFVKRITDQVEQIVTTLPDIDSADCIATGTKLRAYWEQYADWLALSINYNVIDRVNEQVALLICCAKSKDVYGYCTARALLLDAIGDVRRAEQISIGNLF